MAWVTRSSDWAIPKGKEFIRIASLHDALTRTIKDSVARSTPTPKIFDELGEICEATQAIRRGAHLVSARHQTRPD